MRAPAILTAVILALGWATAAAAQPAADVAVSVLSADDGEFPTVAMTITAESAGRPLASIEAADLLVEESGAPAEVISIERALDSNVPLALVLVLDTSGSMAGGTLANAQAGAVALVERLGDADLVSLISFSDGVNVVEPFTPDKGRLVQALGALQPGGNTDLYDAVLEAGKVAQAASALRRVVVLISDGEDFGTQSTAGREASLSAVSESRSVFYIIGIGEQVNRGYLEEIASRSGGAFMYAPGAVDVQTLYSALEERLRSHFVVSVRAASPPEGRERTLRVTLNHGGASAVTTYAFASLRPPVAPAPVVEPPTSPAVPAEVALEGKASGLPVAMLTAPPLVLLALAGGLLFWMRRRRGARKRLTEKAHLELPTPAVEASGEQEEVSVEVLAGGEAVRRFVVTSEPVTIGSDNQCVVSLPEAPGLASSHIRAWMRGGRLLIHHLASDHVTQVDGRDVTWASLDEGDEVRLGPYSLRRVPSSTPATQPDAR